MGKQPFEPGLNYARRLDAADELAPLRDAFHFPEAKLIYLDGNSLGRLPYAVVERVRRLIEEEWGRDLVRGWNRGWCCLWRSYGPIRV